MEFFKPVQAGSAKPTQRSTQQQSTSIGSLGRDLLAVLTSNPAKTRLEKTFNLYKNHPLPHEERSAAPSPERPMRRRRRDGYVLSDYNEDHQPSSGYYDLSQASAQSGKRKGTPNLHETMELAMELDRVPCSLGNEVNSVSASPASSVQSKRLRTTTLRPRDDAKPRSVIEDLQATFSQVLRQKEADTRSAAFTPNPAPLQLQCRPQTPTILRDSERSSLEQQDGESNEHFVARQYNRFCRIYSDLRKHEDASRSTIFKGTLALEEACEQESERVRAESGATNQAFAIDAHLAQSTVIDEINNCSAICAKTISALQTKCKKSLHSLRKTHVEHMGPLEAQAAEVSRLTATSEEDRAFMISELDALLHSVSGFKDPQVRLMHIHRFPGCVGDSADYGP
jgi:hypothetical protein